MGNMKHNVNFGILGLLLLVLVAMVLLVIYYYTTYEKLDRDYQSALSNLQNVSLRVNQTQAELAAREIELSNWTEALKAAQENVNISKQREQNLGGQFTELKGDVQTLSQNLNSTLAERNKYAAQADRYYADSIQYKNRYDQASNDLASANTKLTKIRGDVVELQNQASMFGSELDDMETGLLKIDKYAEDIKNNKNNASIVNMKAGDVNLAGDSMMTTVTALQGQLVRITALINSIGGG
jgi:chromosome segregation ATPase